MRKMKKLASLVLAMIMVFAMTISSSAASITIAGTDTTPTAGHTYKVYQIYTADKSGDTLSNIKYGENYTPGEAKVGDLVPEDELAALNASGADAFAKELIENSAIEGNAVATLNSDNSWKAERLADGYYLIIDETEKVPTGDSVSAYIVQVLDEVSLAPKSGVTTVVKKVDDENDSSALEDEIVWQDSADYDIGDDVPFQITATLPNNVSAYDTYKLILHDTLSKGLTYNENTVVVKIGDIQITSGYEIALTENADGTSSLTITFADVKTLGAGNNSIITVEYTAELNKDAVLGSLGNPNKVYGEYSNNPNSDGTGTTVEDTVIVFTYKVDVNKITKDKVALPGAGFTLYKKNAEGTYVAVSEELTGNDMTTFTWSGLDDGDYRLVETTTPAGYNTISPIEFTVTAEHEILSDNPALKSLSGDVTSGTAEFTADAPAGSLTTDVVNNAGITLPETGGIGTTVFYAIGGVLVLAAIVLLVTRKRMRA